MPGINPDHMNIYLTAIIKSKAGHADAMKALLIKLAAGSNQEAACIQYELHQDGNDPNVFLFHEIWENQEGLNLHNTQPHILEFRADSAAIIDGPATLYQTNKVT